MDAKQRSRMEELIATLNRAAKAYYSEDKEIISNYEYDALYDELVALEESTGTILPGSPTQSVGYEAVESLPKERHDSPMLSLAKTKSREELGEWLGDQEGLLSWKEDGLTVVLTYQDGILEKCVTRGNGEVGEVVTPNARQFINLPARIAYRGRLVVRGEAVIGYSDFQRINDAIPETEAKYKNPRNLCSGSVRQLDSAVTAGRNVKVILFSLVSTEPAVDFSNSFEKQFEFLKEQGFDVVEYERVRSDTVADAVERFAGRIEKNDIPSDGLVLSYDDLSYAASLGRTAKFPRGAIAFKWADETAETKLRYVEWDTSRTGLINPVAVFDPVELEGTTVSRASVHNISYIKELKLGIGDRILVYKANMIIPQIAKNLSASGDLPIPEHCPVCNGEARIIKEADSEVLMCMSAECPAKKLKSFVHFTERDAMNIEGLSEATLEKLIAAGLLHSYSDIYRLSGRRDEILKLEGFQERSCDNLLESIEKSRNTTLDRLVYAIGIPGVGAANARLICRHFDDSPKMMQEASVEELSAIDGVGPVMAQAFYDHMHREAELTLFHELMKELTIEKKVMNASQPLKGLVFVITGSLLHYANRSELKNEIEDKGGKVTGKVTAKTTALINNDITSSSGKNKDAKALEIPILTEDEFLEKYMQE